MIIGYGITAMVTPLYAVIRFPFQVLILRFVERVGKGLRAAPRDSLISASVGKNDTGKNFGFHKMMDNSGAIIGPLFAFAVLYFFPDNYRTIFWLATIPAVLGVLTIIVFIKEERVTNKSSIKLSSYRHLPKKFYFFLVIVAIFSLGNSSDALLLVKTAGTGVSQAYIPVIYMKIQSSWPVYWIVRFIRLVQHISRRITKSAHLRHGK